MPRPPAASMSLERLRADGQAFMDELSREYYLAMSGQKSAAVLQPIYEKYARIMTPDALERTLEGFRGSPPGTDEHHTARMLLEWLAGLQSGRALAPLEERELAWESSTVVTTADGTNVPYERVPIEIANSNDRGYRLAVFAARNKSVAAELAPLRRERLEREREIIERLGLADGYNATWELLSSIDIAELRGQCERFIRDSQPIWDDTAPQFIRRVLGIEPGEATRADAMALFRGQAFDRYFPAAEMESRVTGQVREMGIDPTAGGRIRFDTSEREGKRSRAFCVPVHVPDEVYVVLRPHGGQSDWSTFLHELGHALHFAYIRPDYPFEYKYLGDNSVTESYAMLFDALLEDAAWLKRYTGLGAAQLREFERSVGFEELHFVRRYCAKFVYETNLYGGDVAWSALPDLYVDLLTRATTFQYAPADAFVDVDPGYYSARYLRAWQLQALLNETLTERYDEDWWRNPRAGPWLMQSLFSEGQREAAHQLAKRVSGKELSFAPVLRQIERLLG